MWRRNPWPKGPRRPGDRWPTRAAQYILLASTVILAAPPPPTVRIGVFTLFRAQRLAVKPAAGRVIEVHCGSRTDQIESGRAIGFTIGGPGTIDCTIRGTMVTTESAATISARGGGPTEFLLSVPGKIERRYTGRLEITLRNGALEPVVLMNREHAIAAIVAAESPPDAAPAALEAQAVVARSFLAASGARHQGSDYDFCDTTHCQFLREIPAPGAPARTAAEHTAGQVLAYHGKPIAALFSAACGGQTRTPQTTGLEAQDYPYFAVACAACQRDPQPWSIRLSRVDAQPLLDAPHSETARLAVVRRLGWGSVKSNAYEIAGDGPAAVIVTGRGTGHGIGLCQKGAAAMAREGATARTILEHYFPNTTLLDW
jgi:peptidoglycan hydrolase-like amidase